MLFVCVSTTLRTENSQDKEMRTKNTLFKWIFAESFAFIAYFKGTLPQMATTVKDFINTSYKWKSSKYFHPSDLTALKKALKTLE